MDVTIVIRWQEPVVYKNINKIEKKMFHTFLTDSEGHVITFENKDIIFMKMEANYDKS